MKLATPEAFARDPDEVHAFYNMRRRRLLEVAPNPAHFALAELEADLACKGGNLFLCTQNVDDLHERGGSGNVVHMHGELRKARCVNCGAVIAWDCDLGQDNSCPECGLAGGLRPHVVWFGETPLRMDDIHHALYTADAFVAIGTSGSVYPAAGFVSEARRIGISTREINLEPSDNAHLFDDGHYGPASEAVPAWTQRMLSNS